MSVAELYIDYSSLQPWLHCRRDSEYVDDSQKVEHKKEKNNLNIFKVK